MCGGEVLQLPNIHSASWEVELAQRLHDPDIDRESCRMAEGKQQDTVADFIANALELQELSSRSVQGEVIQSSQIQLALGNRSSSREQKGRSKSHLASPQLRLGASREPIGPG